MIDCEIFIILKLDIYKNDHPHCATFKPQIFYVPLSNNYIVFSYYYI